MCVTPHNYAISCVGLTIQKKLIYSIAAAAIGFGNRWGRGANTSKNHERTGVLHENIQ